MTYTHIPQTRSLTDVLARARAAVVGVQIATIITVPPTVRPLEPPAPTVRPPRPAPTPLRASCAPLEALTDLGELRPGPRRLLELLHRVAVSTVAARAYRVAPSQVTVHQPQELLARALGCHVVTVWRWTRDLAALGLIAARAHFTTSKGATRADGTLYAVALQPGHRAHLAHDDLAHCWRDLDGDRAAGRTAWSVLQGSDPRDKAEWYLILENWSRCPGSVTSHPLPSDHCSPGATLSDVVYTLPLLATAHPSKRPGMVGVLASMLARALDDQHSRRFYCRLIWNAWTAEVEGRAGLQVLAAQLARLDADRREWKRLKRPGALLAFRLRLST